MSQAAIHRPSGSWRLIGSPASPSTKPRPRSAGISPRWTWSRIDDVASDRRSDGARSSCPASGTQAPPRDLQLDDNARINDEPHRQCASRERRTDVTTSGIGPPHVVFCHSGGSGARSSVSSTRAARSTSSMTCCVPIFRAGSLPSRIHRRMVSGFRCARRAASGTVNITWREGDGPSANYRSLLHATTYFSSVDEKEDIPMTGDDLPTSLEDNEVLIYVRPPATGDAAAQPALPREPTLRKVEISDEELDRLRRQVGWIAGRLAD